MGKRPLAWQRAVQTCRGRRGSAAGVEKKKKRYVVFHSAAAGRRQQPRRRDTKYKYDVEEEKAEGGQLCFLFP